MNIECTEKNMYLRVMISSNKHIYGNLYDYYLSELFFIEKLTYHVKFGDNSSYKLNYGLLEIHLKFLQLFKTSKLVS